MSNWNLHFCGPWGDCQLHGFRIHVNTPFGHLVIGTPVQLRDRDGRYRDRWGHISWVRYVLGGRLMTNPQAAANTPRIEPIEPVEFPCPHCGEGIVLRGYFEHPEAAAPTPAEPLDVLRRLVDAVDHQLRRYRATAGWGDSPLSEAIDDARLLLAAARSEADHD